MSEQCALCGSVLECGGCGSTRAIVEIRKTHPDAISCCPERKMGPVDIASLRAQLASARKALEPCAKFAMWALADGSWKGADLNGGDVQDKAESLGLIVKTEYDPKVHGEGDCCKQGDDWFVPSALMNDALAALTDDQGTAVQDTWLVGGPPALKAMSGSTESDRVIQLHFRRKVTDDDRKWLLDAINAALTSAQRGEK